MCSASGVSTACGAEEIARRFEKGLPYWNWLWGDVLTFFPDGKRKEVKKIQSDHTCERTHASWQQNEKKLFFMDKD